MSCPCRCARRAQRGGSRGCLRVGCAFLFPGQRRCRRLQPRMSRGSEMAAPDVACLILSSSEVLEASDVFRRLLFLGYSLEDWDFRTLYRGLIEVLPEDDRRTAFAIQW